MAPKNQAAADDRSGSLHYQRGTQPRVSRSWVIGVLAFAVVVALIVAEVVRHHAA